MNEKDRKKQRGQRLKRLREQHQDSVQRTSALIKEQNALRKPIRQARNPRTRATPISALITAMAPVASTSFNYARCTT